MSTTDIEFGNHALDLIKEGGETTDHVIIWALSRVLDAYYKNHPEVAKVTVRCMREDEGLVKDLRFSRKTAAPAETQP
jgi:hypothetical protein